MLTSILKVVLGVVADVICGKIQLWWAQRQAAAAQAQAEDDRKKLESLQQGQAEEAKISQAAENVKIAAEAAQTWQQQVDAMINRRQVIKGLKDRRARNA